MLKSAITRRNAALTLFCAAAFHSVFALASEGATVNASDDARTSLAACLPRNAATSCVPAMTASAVHFLFAHEGTLYVNLTYDNTEKVNKAIRQEFPGMPTFGYGFGRDLTPEQQSWVSATCHEKVGDSFFCYQPERDASLVAHMKAIAGYAEGANGDLGFVGVLDAPPRHTVKKSEGPLGERIIGIACPGRNTLALRMTPVLHPDKQKLEDIQTALRSQLGDATSRVLHAIESPEDHALLVVAEHDREQFVGTTGVEGKPVTGSEHHRGTSLFYLAATPSGPRIIPFRGVQYAIEIAPEKGFPLDIYPGSRENTRVYLLPDMNDNGLGEVLIICNEGFLFCPPVPGKAPDDNKGMGPSQQFFYGIRE